jgi:hypothetical protein
MGMRRVALAVISVLALLWTPAEASATRGRHASSARCAPTAHVLLADAEAQVYSAREGPLKYLTLRGCVYGRRGSFRVTECGNGISAVGCSKAAHVTLAGTMVAREVAFVSSGHEIEKSTYEFEIWVEDLRTGHLLHKVPTGTPREAETKYYKYVGVGGVVALVLKSDGAVAWIAEDDERSSGRQTGPEVLYFDVYAVDRSGTRLLAAGTNIDPASLALSTGGSGIGSYSRTVVGSTLYWTQGSSTFSTALN